MEFVFPYNNEQEFANVANRLGIKKLVFLYEEKDYLYSGKLLESETNVEIEKGIFLRKPLANMKSKHIVAKSSEKDRFIIENKKADIIFGFEDTQRKDFMHQRASGLNHVLCSLLRQNNIAVGFSYSSLLREHSSIVAGRMAQNFRLCKKFKVKTLIASFTDDPYELRSSHDINSLSKILGF